MAAYVRSWTPKLWLGSRGGPHVKKSLLILLSWLVKQRFLLGPVPAALSQLVPVGVVLEGAIWDDPAIEANYVSAEERRGSIHRKKRNFAQVIWMLERWEAVVLRLWILPPGGDSIGAFSKRPSGRGAVSVPIPFSSAMVERKGLSIQSLLVRECWGHKRGRHSPGKEVDW